MCSLVSFRRRLKRRVPAFGPCTLTGTRPSSAPISSARLADTFPTNASDDSRGASPSEWLIAKDRGYSWACGQGHTDYNHPAYNPRSDQFAVTCRTDIAGGLYFRTDTMGKPEPFHNVQSCCGAIGGGATTMAG